MKGKQEKSKMNFATWGTRGLETKIDGFGLAGLVHS